MSQVKVAKKLLKQMDKTEAIFQDDSLDWEVRYDLIFQRYQEKIRPRLEELGIRLEYYDPDTTYEEDVTAYVTALLNLRERVQAILKHY